MATPPDRLRALARLHDHAIDCALARNRSTPQDVLVELLKRRDPRVCLLVASRGALSDDLAVEIARHPLNDVRCRLARRAKLPESVQRQLAIDEVFHVQYALLTHAQLSEDVLSLLADAPDPLVRLGAARRAGTSSRVLRRASTDTDPAVAHEAAVSIHAPGDVLERLAEHSDPFVRASVARNLAAPAMVRSRLARDEDEAVRYCAGFAALQVRDAASIDQFASHPDASFRWLVATVGSEDVVVALMHDRSARVRWTAVLADFGAEPDLVERGRDRDPMVRQCLAQRSARLPAAVATILANDSDTTVRAVLAERGDLGDDLRERLSSDDDAHVRRAARPSASIDQITTSMVRRVRAASITKHEMLAIVHLLEQGDDMVDCEVARNRRIRLPRHPRDWGTRSLATRHALARRRDLDEGLRERLTSDDATLVRLEIAANPVTPAGTLVLLARDEDHMVRAAVARHRNSPRSVLRDLVDDIAYEVRATLAERAGARLDADSRRALATNDRFRVALAASTRTPKALLAEFVTDPSNFVVMNAAGNVRTRPDDLVAVLGHPNAKCRSLAARRVPDVSDEQAYALAGDSCWWVREAFAENPVAPGFVLEVLAREDSFGTARAVARHRNTPTASLDELALAPNHEIHGHVAHHPSASPEALTHLARDATTSTRAAVARHANTPAPVLARLSRDKTTAVRNAVAQNPNTHPRTLWRLAADHSDRIRADVAASPRATRRLLDHLSPDPSAGVRVAVAGHSRTPLAVLLRLVDDKESVVRRSVATNPRLPLAERVLAAIS